MAWLGNWAYRIPITISHLNIDEDLTWYPLPIFLNSSAGTGDDDVTEIFDELGSNQYKIAVTQADGITPLFVEVQLWSSGDEEAILWVSRDGWTISDSEDTTIYLYYDNNQNDNTGYIGKVGHIPEVWDDNFVLVCHMQTSAFIDSTKYGNNGTNVGCSISTNGKMGSCADLEAATDYISFPDASQLDLTDAMTLQGWTKTENENDHGRVIAKQYDGVGTAASCYQLCQIGSNNTTETAEFRHAGKGTVNWDISPSSPKIAFGTWYFRASTWSNATGNAKLYLDNSILDTTGSLTGTIRTSSYPVTVGASIAGGNPDYFFDGLIDEVRISNVERSEAWMKADYYSQDDEVLSFGSTENLPAGSGVEWLGSWKYRIPITISGTNIDSHLLHYPLPIFLSSTAGINDQDVTAVFDEISSDSDKIAVTMSGGTDQLYVEIEYWDDTGEEAVLWVSKKDWSIDKNDTIIYLYYDSNQSSNTTYVGSCGSSVAENVWDPAFKGVYHLGESSGDALDSTGNQDGTYGGALPTQITGKIGKGQDWEGDSDDSCDIDSSNTYIPTTRSPITLQGWAKPESISAGNSYDRMITIIRVDEGGSALTLGFGSDDNIQSYIYGEGHVTYDTAVSAGNWYFVGVTYDGYTFKFYKDGVTDADDVVITGIGGGNTTACIGNFETGNSTYDFDGILDEVRISNRPRSADWMKVDYYSQSDNILVFGAAEVNEVSESPSDGLKLSDSSDYQYVRPRRWWANNTLSWTTNQSDYSWRYIVASGNIYNESLSDGIVFSDSVSNVISVSISISDGFTLSDTVGCTASVDASASDGITFGEVISEAASVAVSLTDGIKFGDSTTASLMVSIDISDGLVFTDESGNTLTIDESVFDEAIFSDQVVPIAEVDESITDGIVFGETIAFEQNIYMSATDGIVFGESISKTLTAVASAIDGVIFGELVSGIDPNETLIAFISKDSIYYFTADGKPYRFITMDNIIHFTTEDTRKR